MSEQAKLDVYRANKADYAAPKKPVVLEIAPAQYLVIDGRGKPGDELFQDAIGSLYGVAFTVKMTYKQHSRDYTVCKLEAVWRIEGEASFQEAAPDDIHYRLMIRTPEFIAGEHLAAAQEALATRGKAPRAPDVTLQTLREGRCIQMLHVGPYDQEPLTVARMRVFAEEIGLVPAGDLHEIYLSDPRRVPPERLRTILRLPVRSRTEDG